MPRTYEETIKDATVQYLDSIDMSNPPSPNDVQQDILYEISIQFQMENACHQKGTLWKIPHRLSPAQLTAILMKMHNIVNIAFAGTNAPREFDVLAIYQTDGINKGIYVSDKQAFYKQMHEYCFNISEKEVNETLALLKHEAKRVVRNSDKNLIAVNNGIFDYDTKQLLPFSPDYVFVSKSKVDYNPNATNIVIHNDDDNTDWDIESWMADLFDNNQALTHLMWQIVGAIIRPNVPWNKSAWFYANTGNNGKETLCEFMRQIAGKGTYASIPLSDFAKDFMLEPLLQASCIIVDENDVGEYIDKAANLKAIITNDVIQMNRKFKMPVAFQFKGFMVQCLNELPRFKDKSESFYRRLLFVPFSKCFTGAERKYIKADYLRRKEVLEYALYKVLNMDYYSLDEPPECKAVLEEYKGYNDPVRQFLDEMLPKCVWDLLPFKFLFDLYKAWFADISPTGSPVGRNTFIFEVKKLIGKYSEWEVCGKERTLNRMYNPEPLIKKYNLRNWMNPNYRGSDVEKMCHPDLQKNYSGGLLRRP